MKLLRYGEKGQEKPGIVDTQGNIRDLSNIISDVDGSTISAESLAILQAVALDSLTIVEEGVRLGPCVNKVGKFLCIGLNYEDHARETGGGFYESHQRYHWA